MEKPEVVDLEPHQWTSEREKHKEPLFGSGWPVGLGVLITIFAAAFLIEYQVVPRALGVGIGAVIGSVAAFIAASLSAGSPPKA